MRQHPYRDVPYLLNSQEGPLKGKPLAFVHRGGSPTRENTMAAFREAVAMGYRYIEIDVRTAACGTLVVFHDEHLDRVTTGRGRLSDHTWEELSRLKVGLGGTYTEPLVRFEDLLAEWDDVHLNVDLKDGASVKPFAELVERFGAHHRVLAASFNDARRHRVNTLLSTKVATSGGWVATGLIVLLGPLGFLRRVSRRMAEIDCVQVPIEQGRIRIVRPKFIERCHRAGLQVHVWVVDEPAQMHRLLDMGVDGLMTDDAAALAQVMREREAWPQRDVQGS
ncbi:glycerophosphodiester phosphodiesterase [Nesterenkonia flava]|uniref:Glycerophosphodiester phosphodiesterase n=1 Tax=Nesterenkonia flava TaxID=469799 RepID=A0ABU1FVW2_9MICC|nr:glycerophosphodiester phosphodiesterase [Nesterenkonia flava]MDR5712813.1 glycerophosphodiester phosphodiesterase [Nesterenkonia flava]